VLSTAVINDYDVAHLIRHVQQESGIALYLTLVTFSKKPPLIK